MSRSISIETAGRELESILKQLSPGESVTLVDSNGSPVATLISLTAPAEKKLSTEERMARWEALAQEVGRAWKGDKGAVETLSEMRR
ncbi:MAG: hypothetical protein AB1631_24870 [Acidobacteriota bacterium]